MSQINAAELRKRAPLAISVGIVAVLAIALVSGSSVYTDVLWLALRRVLIGSPLFFS